MEARKGRRRGTRETTVKIQILADLHLEFGHVEIPRTDADVGVLAGDVACGLAGLEWIGKMFPDQPVIYVAGNHEYYGHALPWLTNKLRARATGNIHFLENGSVEFGSVRFLGCTLWTDFELYGPDIAQRRCMDAARSALTDYARVRHDPDFRRLRPDDTARFHRESRAWLAQELARPFGGATVVVTHHAPSIRSVAPQYQDDPLTAAFASNLEEFVCDNEICLWVHGHTHHCVD